jgi:hypothetical protein
MPGRKDARAFAKPWFKWLPILLFLNATFGGFWLSHGLVSVGFEVGHHSNSM